MIGSADLVVSVLMPILSASWLSVRSGPRKDRPHHGDVLFLGLWTPPLCRAAPSLCWARLCQILEGGIGPLELWA
jgi:hypothetical protein